MRVVYATMQPLYLGIHRSDYMMHVTPEGGWDGAGMLQVEFNTISASFGVLSSRVAAMHRCACGSRRQ
jgi:glutathione synthase